MTAQDEINQLAEDLVLNRGYSHIELHEELDDLYGTSLEEATKLFDEIKGFDKKKLGDKEKALALYDESYSYEIYQLALLGRTRAQIAEHFKVDMYTLNMWRFEIPEAGEAWERATKADLAVVETLLKLCLGYEEPDVKIGFSMGEPVYAPFVKKIQPNLKAIETWLKSKYPLTWKETQHIETNGLSSIEALSDTELAQRMNELGLIEAPSKLSQLEVVEE